MKPPRRSIGGLGAAPGHVGEDMGPVPDVCLAYVDSHPNPPSCPSGQIPVHAVWQDDSNHWDWRCWKWQCADPTSAVYKFDRMYPPTACVDRYGNELPLDQCPRCVDWCADRWGGTWKERQDGGSCYTGSDFGGEVYVNADEARDDGTRITFCRELLDRVCSGPSGPCWYSTAQAQGQPDQTQYEQPPQPEQTPDTQDYAPAPSEYGASTEQTNVVPQPSYNFNRFRNQDFQIYDPTLDTSAFDTHTSSQQPQYQAPQADVGPDAGAGSAAAAEEPKKSSPWPWILGGLAVVGVGAAIVVAARRR